MSVRRASVSVIKSTMDRMFLAFMVVVGAAIGVSGLPPLWDRRGERDLFGRPLEHTVTALADQVAAAADLLAGQAAELRAVVVLRGLSFAPSRDGGTNGLYRPIGLPLPFLFGPGSLARHIDAARERDIAARLFRAPGLELDIDQPDDLLRLADAPGETAAQQLVRELCVDARLACV